MQGGEGEVRLEKKSYFNFSPFVPRFLVTNRENERERAFVLCSVLKLRQTWKTGVFTI